MAKPFKTASFKNTIIAKDHYKERRSDFSQNMRYSVVRYVAILLEMQCRTKRF
jgi:hypothetical protein